MLFPNEILKVNNYKKMDSLLINLKVKVRQFSLSIFLAVLAISCKDKSIEEPTPLASKSIKDYDVNLSIKWADLTLKILRTTAAQTPPVASRVLGYVGLTMYESGVYGMSDYQSLQGQITWLTTLPKPDLNKKYNWALSVNSAQYQILRDLFSTTSEANIKTLDSLKSTLETALINVNNDDTTVVNRSKSFGVSIAKAIWVYSKTDGGHEAFKNNFPTDYKVPVGIAYWEPTENGRKIPMLPYWGKNRTFASANGALSVPQIPKSPSYREASDFFKEYNEVYQKNKILTQEEKEISVWWADDPSETFTPPGHSYSIAKIAVLTSKAKLDQSIEAFAKTGMAVADAFILCWKTKYTFMNIRPYSYVRQTIDPTWIPFWPAPPFPGFPSGHSTQSAASAIVLESVFGTNFEFIDTSWQGRPKDAKRNVEFKPRKLKSFWAAAEESALSRFYGGIHTNMDNLAGLAEGKKIGVNIVQLKFKK